MEAPHHPSSLWSSFSQSKEKVYFTLFSYFLAPSSSLDCPLDHLFSLLLRRERLFSWCYCCLTFLSIPLFHSLLCLVSTLSRRICVHKYCVSTITFSSWPTLVVDSQENCSLHSKRNDDDDSLCFWTAFFWRRSDSRVKRLGQQFKRRLFCNYMVMLDSMVTYHYRLW